MKYTIKLLLPVMVSCLAVGFMLYRNLDTAEEGSASDEINVTSGAVSDDNGVPDDIYFSSPVESVRFSHEKHAVDLGFKCNTCHSGIFQMKAHTAQGQQDFNMQGLAEGKYCGACHSAEHDVAFASDNQCARCHTGVQGLGSTEATA